MARASFGGSADYSSLFASVYGNQEQQAKNDATQAKNDAAQAKYDAEQAKAIQAAQDQDMANQWQNGVISNEAWLAYIDQRIAQTTDPKENQKWVGYQRIYSQQIADSTAEFNFSNGGSISELIAYYQEKIATKAIDSKDAQKDGLRLNDLIDQRASTQLQDGITKISNAIAAGTATYKDLLKFEQDSRLTIRAGSPLATQLATEIDRVTKQIVQQDTEGRMAKAEYDYKSKKITGRQYAAFITKEAAQYKDSDPKTYYQYLQTANEYLTKSPGTYGSGGSGGSGRGPKSSTVEHDANQAARANATFYLDEAKSGKKTTIGSDGKPVTLSPSFIAGLEKQVLSSYDSDSAIAAARGDKSSAANYGSKKLEFMNNYILPQNTMAANERDLNIATARSKVLDQYQGAAGYNSEGKPYATGFVDPLAAQRLIAGWVAQDKKTLQADMYKITQTEKSDGRGTITTVGGSKSPIEGGLTPEYIAQKQAEINALQVALNPNATQAEIDAVTSTVEQISKTNPVFAGAWLSAAQNTKNLQGVQSGERVLVVNVKGLQQWVDQVPSPVDHYSATGKVTGSTLRPDMAQAGAGPDSQVVDVIVDVNGVPTHRLAVATPQSTGFVVWKIGGSKELTLEGGKKGKKTFQPGQVLTSADLEFLDTVKPNWRELVAGADSNSQIWAAPADGIGSALTVTINDATDKNGKVIPSMTFTQDPQAKTWNKGDLRIRSVQYNPDGTVEVASNGQVQVIFAPDSGTFVPFAGTNLKAAQGVLNSDGTIDLSGRRGRDMNGTIVPEPTRGAATTLYDPADFTQGLSPDARDEARRTDAAYQARRIQKFGTLTTPPGGQPGEGQSKQFDSIKNYGNSLGMNFGTKSPGIVTRYSAPSSTFSPTAPPPFVGATPTQQQQQRAPTFTGFTPPHGAAPVTGPTAPPVVFIPPRSAVLESAPVVKFIPTVVSAGKALDDLSLGVTAPPKTPVVPRQALLY